MTKSGKMGYNTIEFIQNFKEQKKVCRRNVKTINWDKEGRLTYIFNNPAHTGNGTKALPIIYNKPTAETIDMLHPNESGSKWLAITVAKELIKNKRHK